MTVRPHCSGTLNILGSVDRCGVKHYVHTSSVAAIGNQTKQTAFDENDWGDAMIGGTGTDSYQYAKLMGEKVVWDYIEGGKPYTVSCINPTMVFGPCLSKAHAKASPFVFRQALYGNDFPNTPMSVVDVRDVATAHVEALVRPEANGKRFIVDNDDLNASTNDHIKHAARLYPQYQFSLSTIRDPPTRDKHPLGYMKKSWDNSLSKQVLGMSYISDEQCIRETVSSMVEPGWVPAKAKKKAARL